MAPLVSNGWAEPADLHGGYFPDSRVASRGLALTPVTQPVPMHGPDNRQAFQSSFGPPVFDPVQPGLEQGVGVGPERQWPHMPHVEQYNFETTTEIAWHDDGPDYSDRSGTGGRGAAGDRYGWALVGPEGAGHDPSYYYGAGPAEHQWYPDPITIEDPHTMAYSDLGYVPS